MSGGDRRAAPARGKAPGDPTHLGRQRAGAESEVRVCARADASAPWLARGCNMGRCMNGACARLLAVLDANKTTTMRLGVARDVGLPGLRTVATAGPARTRSAARFHSGCAPARRASVEVLRREEEISRKSVPQHAIHGTPSRLCLRDHGRKVSRRSTCSSLAVGCSCGRRWRRERAGRQSMGEPRSMRHSESTAADRSRGARGAGEAASSGRGHARKVGTG